MRCYFDLHVHSALSPCADDEMTVADIAQMAAIKGLDFIAVTDHNSLRNCPGFHKACQRVGVVPVPGAEVCSAEEVHLLCLFPSVGSAMDFDDALYRSLPDINNRTDIFGRQLIMDEWDNIVGEEPRLLSGASKMDLFAIDREVTGRGGIVIPSHIEKPAFSLLSNLGFVPPDPDFCAFEVQRKEKIHSLLQENHQLFGKNLLCNSDAHALHLIKERENTVEVAEKSPEALLASLRCYGTVLLGE